MIGPSRTPWAAKALRRENAVNAWRETKSEPGLLPELGLWMLASGVTMGAMIAVQQAMGIGVSR